MPRQAFYRDATLEVNPAKTGIANLSFASELPALRHDRNGKKYWEVLSHDKKHANLELLNRQGIVLRNPPMTRWD